MSSRRRDASLLIDQPKLAAMTKLDRRQQLISALIGLSVVSFCMCAATAYNGVKALDLAKTGHTTEATVVQIDRYPRGDIVTITFDTADGPITTKCDQCPDGMSFGQHLTVRYDPDYPATVERAGSNSYRGLMVFMAFLLVAALTGTAVVGWRLSRQRRS